jgi:hypothetical protein
MGDVSQDLASIDSSSNKASEVRDKENVVVCESKTKFIKKEKQKFCMKN